MARLQIDDSVGCGMTFFSGQLFVLDSITLHADSIGHLGQIKKFAPGRIIRFGNLEYAADSGGELAFSGWVSDQTVQISNSIPDQDHGMDLIAIFIPS